MKKENMRSLIWGMSFCTMLALLVTTFVAGSRAEVPSELLVADFDTGSKPNNIGGDFGAWDKDPADDTQGVTVDFNEDDALDDPVGYSLKMVYDVKSPNPAYNGFWMKLGGLDVANYQHLSFRMKGEGEFTKRVKIELKDSGKRASAFVIKKITEDWQEFRIPIRKFSRLRDLHSLSEFVVVFDDIYSSPKEGTIYLDHVRFV